MSDFLAGHAYESDAIRDALVARGFTDDGQALFGDVVWRTGGIELHTAVRLEMGEAFPFGPPKVFLDEQRRRETDPTPTFHVELSGALCLYGRDVEVHEASWRNADRLLDQVAGWLERSADGWSNDTATDLERYLPADTEFLLYDADELEGRTGVLRFDGARVRRLKPAARPSASSGRKGKRKRSVRSELRTSGPAGYLLDVGELSSPVLGWPDLLMAAGDQGRKFERLVRLRIVTVAVLRYTRSGQPGVLALSLRPSAEVPGGVALAAIESADVSLASRELRSGTAAASLARVRIAVVGCGAVGSYVADLLLRSGVRRLRLIDHQRLRPGNVVRHLAGDRYVGAFKTEAVRACLAATGLPVEGVSVELALMTTAQQASNLVSGHSLVIDATGDQRAAALLQMAALDVGAALVKVCLQREGGIVRVDRFPLQFGESHAPSVPVLPGAVRMRERGCGDAVSLTPPHAVVTAAALAVRTAVAVLTGVASNASHVEVLAVQPDGPYQRLGPVRPRAAAPTHVGSVAGQGSSSADRSDKDVSETEALDGDDPSATPVDEQPLRSRSRRSGQREVRRRER